MGRFAVLGLLLAGATPALALGTAGDDRPTAGDGDDPAAHGKRLVLAVVGNERSASAVHGERVVVADPAGGQVRSRMLPGGTLCHGPLMAAGDRVVYTGYRGSKAVLMSLPLTLTGAPSPFGPADTIIPSARPGHVWLGRWDQAGKRTRATFREVAVPGEEATSRARGGSGRPPASPAPSPAAGATSTPPCPAGSSSRPVVRSPSGTAGPRSRCGAAAAPGPSRRAARASPGAVGAAGRCACGPP